MSKTPSLKVGDYATVTNALGQRVWTGIVYEDGTLLKSGGTPRIQLADGHKVKEIPPDSLSPATEAEIATFKAAATEGMTPEAIIEREGGEHKPKAALKHHQKHHPTGQAIPPEVKGMYPGIAQGKTYEELPEAQQEGVRQFIQGSAAAYKNHGFLLVTLTAEVYHIEKSAGLKEQVDLALGQED